MRLTIRRLRELIKEAIAGSQPEEDYEIELMDDPAMNKPSVYVRDDAKKKIKSWAKDMHLSTK